MLDQFGPEMTAFLAGGFCFTIIIATMMVIVGGLKNNSSVAMSGAVILVVTWLCLVALLTVNSERCKQACRDNDYVYTVKIDDEWYCARAWNEEGGPMLVRAREVMEERE